jgi:basic membrane protein A and related proteins
VTTRRIASVAAGAVTAALLLASVPAAIAQGPMKVVGAYVTPIEEPWDGVIDTALKAAAAAGTIDYTFSENIGYGPDMERVLREIAAESPAAIFGDAFVIGDQVRAVAADFPDIPFIFGSDGGPVDPNLSVFDNWIQEPAYLAGMLAGGLTKSNIIGAVGAMPIPEVNRLINAYIAGARAVNDQVEVKVSFIDSFFDPDTAKEAALAQIEAGADVLYAERDGVIQAAQEKGVLAVGNMSDQSSQAPETVVTSVIWDMAPTVDYVLKQIAAGAYAAQDLGYFSSYAKGGAKLAPIMAGVPQDLLDKVTAVEESIKSGAFRVDVNEGTPDGSRQAPAATSAG